MKIGVLASYSFTFLSTLNNHIPLKIGESEHDVTDELARRRIINNAHVKHVNNNALIVEALDELNAVNDTTGNTVELSDNEFVAYLNNLQEFIKLGSSIFRAAEDTRENFDSPCLF